MSQATANTSSRKSNTLHLAYIAAGLAILSIAGDELGAINRTSSGYQAVKTGGRVLGLFAKQRQAIDAIQSAAAPF